MHLLKILFDVSSKLTHTFALFMVLTILIEKEEEKSLKFTSPTYYESGTKQSYPGEAKKGPFTVPHVPNFYWLIDLKALARFSALASNSCFGQTDPSWTFWQQACSPTPASLLVQDRWDLLALLEDMTLQKEKYSLQINLVNQQQIPS